MASIDIGENIDIGEKKKFDKMIIPCFLDDYQQLKVSFFFLVFLFPINPILLLL